MTVGAFFGQAGIQEVKQKRGPLWHDGVVVEAECMSAAVILW